MAVAVIDGRPQRGLRDPRMREYRKAAPPVRARQTTQTETIAVSWQATPLVAQPGDWVCTDGESEWPVAADIFADSYERLPDGRYHKTATVWACQMAEPFVVETLEGRAHGQAGDWLVQSLHPGEAWLIPAQDFDRTYVPVA